jgi:hypothetical protein
VKVRQRMRQETGGSSHARRWVWFPVLLGVVTVLLLAGCGGGSSSSTSSTVSQSELQAAKEAGEHSARERDRVDNLQRQVKKLRHQVRHASRASSTSGGSEPSAAPVTQSEDDAQAPTPREFHVASGNVSCAVQADGATCTVEPIAESFVLAGGEEAYSEPSSVLPLDLGEVVPYGSTVTVGTVTCEIPPSNVPSGVVCIDSSSGHGFEASRVGSRQKVY